MGPEDSEKKEVKVYMMVDGQPVEIAPEIAEIKLPEVQQGGDVLPLQECEVTMEARLTAPMMPDEAEAVKRTSVIIAKKSGASLEEAVAIVMRAIQDFGNGLKAVFDPFLGEPDLTMFEPGEPLDVPTAWDRKEEREKQRVVERAASSRFRQYKARESAWAARERTGQRRREWRGPDRT